MKRRPNPALIDGSSNLVLDMYHSSVQALPGSKDDEDEGRLIVDPRTIAAMKHALVLAKNLGTFDVLTKRTRGSNLYKVPARVRIEDFQESRQNSSYLKVVLRLSREQDDAAMTQLTVSFGRDGVTEWLKLQGNPISTLTGQNIWPLQGTFKPEHQPTMMFAWPYLTFLAICRAADPGFKAPFSVVKSILHGGMTLQNAQFATYLRLPEKHKETFFALIGTAFGSPRVRSRKEGGMAAFHIGNRLGIKAVARQSGWERRVNQDEKRRPGGMIVACRRIGKSLSIGLS